MAVERWRRTERMKETLDAFKAEFPLQQGPFERYTDYGSPSPEESAIADAFAKELYEINEQSRALSERYRAIREWQMRYHSQYPMAPMATYHPPPQEEPKPQIKKPPQPSPQFESLKTSGKVVGKITDLLIHSNYKDVTWGDTEKTYLVGPKMATLTADFEVTPELAAMIQGGAGLSVGFDPAVPKNAVVVSGTPWSSDDVYESLKGKFAETLKGKKFDSIIYDDTDLQKWKVLPPFLKKKGKNGPIVP